MPERIAATPNPISGEVAARLLAVRTKVANETQVEFATRLGFSKNTYIAWERGLREPPYALLRALKREFGIDPSWVIEGPEEDPRQHVSDTDPGVLREAYELVEGELDSADLEADEDLRWELVTKVYKLLVEDPKNARGLVAATFKLRRKR